MVELMRGLSHGEFAFVACTAVGTMITFGIGVYHSTDAIPATGDVTIKSQQLQPAVARISAETFAGEVRYARAAVAALAVLCYLYVDELNMALNILWEDYLLTSGLFRHDSWEPLIASLSFAIVILTWVVIDFYLPFLHRYRISKSDDLSSWKGRESLIFREFSWYLAPLLVIDFFFPRRTLPQAAPTFPQLLWQIALALFVFDFIFFCGHCCFHKFSFLYRAVHSEHHSSRHTRASDAIRHTFWDGTWDVICSVLALNLTRAHPLSRTIYNVVAITLITEAHCGSNFPWMLHNIAPNGWMQGPVLHDLHHKIGRVNFQKYFTYLDYLAGTLRTNPESIS